ncbi:MAG: porin [Glaciimonas sp.]|nr:porin [Glaciimonas sp.]
MKKYLVAVAVSGTCIAAAHAQTNVTIYGIINPSVTYTDTVAAPNATNPRATGSRLSLDTAVLQGSRIGFKGSEDLGNGLKAVFTLESGFNADTGVLAQGGLIFGRTAIVGLSDASAGTVLLGRQKDYIDDLASYNGALDFGSMVNNIHALNLDRTQGSRINNSIRYNSPKLNGFTLSGLYGFGEQAGSAPSGQSLGFGGKYENGPLSVGSAYFQSKLAANGSVTGSSDAGFAVGALGGHAGDTSLKTFLIGASYQAGPTRLYGSFSQVKQPLAAASGTVMPTTFSATSGAAFAFGGINNSKVSLLDLGVTYAVTPTTLLLANVVTTRSTFISAADGKATQVTLGIDYFLSKRTDVYLFYANTRASNMYSPGLYVAPGASNSQNVVTTGIRHKF